MKKKIYIYIKNPIDHTAVTENKTRKVKLVVTHLESCGFATLSRIRLSPSVKPLFGRCLQLLNFFFIFFLNHLYFNLTAPVGVADGALPLGRRHAHAAAVADAVAAAVAHGARVPQLAQRPLAAGAGALAVLPGGALGASPPQLLELQLHPPEVK